jgi:hypothetical protein
MRGSTSTARNSHHRGAPARLPSPRVSSSRVTDAPKPHTVTLWRTQVWFRRWPFSTFLFFALHDGGFVAGGFGIGEGAYTNCLRERSPQSYRHAGEEEFWMPSADFASSLPRRRRSRAVGPTWQRRVEKGNHLERLAAGPARQSLTWLFRARRRVLWGWQFCPTCQRWILGIGLSALCGPSRPNSTQASFPISYFFSFFLFPFLFSFLFQIQINSRF